MSRNKVKYPVALCKGRSDKHTAYAAAVAASAEEATHTGGGGVTPAAVAEA